jgi:hypothetical protein
MPASLENKMEPEIIINGITLSEGESMTVRVALQNFAMSLEKDGLGDDRHGEMMRAAYLANIDRINDFMKMPPAE